MEEILKEIKMNREDIKKKVKSVILSQFGIPREEVEEKHNFISDLKGDSLDTVEIVMEIENEFDIKISDDDAYTITTVKKLIDYLEKKLV